LAELGFQMMVHDI